jgi:hypothetical protein
VLHLLVSHSLLFPQEFIKYMKFKSSRPLFVSGFHPTSVFARPNDVPPLWVDLQGNPASPPRFSSLPSPSAVLSGQALPVFDKLRLRDPASFLCGHLHRFYHSWESIMGALPCFSTVRPWLRDGVDITSFFQHYQGEFNGRLLNSASPPHMLFQNAPICWEFKDFITATILKRLEEGSMLCLGRVGVDPPPHVVNALSVEPSKPRLILSMRAVNLFCRETPFTLAPLSDIVRSIPHGSFFSSSDDIQGYKQLSLTSSSYPFCGFEWSGWWFCDTTLPFGWKNSAYVYTTIGSVLSSWLHQRGIHSELWIDDRFVGLAPDF